MRYPTAPVVRMAVTRLRQLAPLIQAAGLQISRELGYQPAASAARALIGKKDTAEARLAKVAL